MKFNGQYLQDKFLYEVFFQNKKDEGFFLDIGAHDGVDISNTLFFEKELNWKGICIEPITKRFESLSKNRNCICINGCISDVEGEEEFITFPEYTDMLSGLKKNFDEQTKQDVESIIWEQNKHKSETIKVKCFKIENILNQYNIKNIDYANIDTEGSEMTILKTIDFDKFHIDLLTIENNKHDDSIKSFMESKNYSYIITLGCDEIYKKN